MSRDIDESFMRLAIELAKKGEGCVEPNPMVGCVLVRNGTVVGQGYHEKFGGPHAEVNAIESTKDNASLSTTGTTAYVTLEPCSHVGKTGPCSQALIAAGVSRVVIACKDPNPLVAGNGIKQLRAAGIEVDTGVLEDQARVVLAPFLKTIEKQTPWIIAKWAMTLDGKIATRTGDSKWISNEQSRAVVHQLRSRVDAIMVGIGTAIADDPMLNARLDETLNPQAGCQSTRAPALRVIVDTNVRLSSNSKLAQTAHQYPTLIAVHSSADKEKCELLESLGCEIFTTDFDQPNERLTDLLRHLSAQRITNLLVEGGGQLLGSLNDMNQIDEVHCFIGPKIIGGENTVSPIQGSGFDLIKNASELDIQSVQQIGDDIYTVGRTRRDKD